MKLLKIQLTNQCNFACPRCPMEEWRNHKPDSPLANAQLLPFLDKFDNSWAIELTGGEPALYPEFSELMEYLEHSHFKGLIKTNGSIPMQKYANFKRIAAWHHLLPKYYDELLIVRHLDWREKVVYCEANKLPYKTIGAGACMEPCPEYKIDTYAYIWPDGLLGRCEAMAGGSREHISAADVPNWETPCQMCKFQADFARFYK